MTSYTVPYELKVQFYVFLTNEKVPIYITTEEIISNEMQSIGDKIVKLRRKYGNVSIHIVVS
ncbi:MAG: hypothetical protein RSE56_03770 [Bacilli bacterium]